MTTHTTTATNLNPWLVFDVESAGLHGEGFAVGWVVVQAKPTPVTLADGIAVCAADDVPEWVRINVLPGLPKPTHRTAQDVREAFWAIWDRWREEGALLAADVAWPVEANFLTTCIAEGRGQRDWSGPYPLIDIASIRLAARLDPLAEAPRLPNEYPAHNPLADARQSARLLMEALQR